MTTASHIAFEAERAWADDVIAALAAPDGEALAAVLARWWARRDERLEAARLALSPREREHLRDQLEPEHHGALDAVPATVRAAALHRVRLSAPMLQQLRELNAPAIVLGNQRATIAAQLAQLDPSSPWSSEPVPVLPRLPPEDEGGPERVDLHAWLDLALHAAQADAHEVGLGARFDVTPEAQAFHGHAGDSPPRPPMADGWQQTTFAMVPDLAFWSSPRIVLPRPLALPDGRLVVTEAGGPVSVAFAGDRVAAALDGGLASRVRALAPDRVLISFVWLETDPAGPWG